MKMGIKLSSPSDLRKAHPSAGWESARRVEPMPEYREKTVSTEVDAIVYDIIRMVEEALKDKNIRVSHANDLRNGRHSVSFNVEFQIETKRLSSGFKKRLPKNANQEFVLHYKQAGWDGVEIANYNSCYRDKDEPFKTIKVRLTHWQKMAEDEPFICR